MGLIKMILAACAVFGAVAYGSDGAQPLSDNCLPISAVARCNAAGAAIFSECADAGLGDDSVAVLVTVDPQPDLPGVVLTGGVAGTERLDERVVSDCGLPLGNVFVCPLDELVVGTFSVFVSQSGFFTPIEAPENCREGFIARF